MEDPSVVESRNRHNKWIAALLWMALLAAIVYTSSAALSMLLSASFLSTGMSALSGDYNSSGGGVIVGGLFAIVVIVLLLTAWLQFVDLSRSLIVSYAWLEEQDKESTLFYDLLVYPSFSDDADLPDKDAASTDFDRAQSTLVSNVIRYLAFTWAAMLAMSPLSLLAGTLF